VTITLSLVDNSLYAIPVQNYIEVTSDNMLYLDGRASIDARDNSNTNYQFTWACLNRTTANLGTASRVMIYPDNRTTWGVNAAG
jgi:hypothetical protein